ncbi:MAG: diacylglycerol kinase family protein [Vicinamibacterales bacterium]
MRAKLIVNPVSGSDAGADSVQSINRRLREGVSALDIVLTVGEGDAMEAARRAAQDGYDHVFVAGGDGTLNETLNGIASVAGALARITFGLIPLGTGNDFAAALGVPEDVDAAVDIILDGHTEEVDVGTVNNRSFINVSAGGFLAEVSDAVDPRLKSMAGKLAYIIGGAEVAWGFEPLRARIANIQDFTAQPGGGKPTLAAAMDLYAFAVCNAPLVGGGRLIAPHARIDDGRLDVCLMSATSTVDFLTLLRHVSAGEHVDDERVVYFQARSLELSFDRTIKVNADGQVLEAARCEYGVLPRAARFLMPASDMGRPMNEAV